MASIAAASFAVSAGNAADCAVQPATSKRTGSSLFCRTRNFTKLLCERIRAHLELEHLRTRSLAAFLMPWRVHRIARPHAATFPSGVWIVDASIDVPRMESQRIRHAQRQRLHLSVLRPQDEERVRVDVAPQQNILPETERIVVIDVGEIQHVGAGLPRWRRSFE